jgi:hypothetical protein
VLSSEKVTNWCLFPWIMNNRLFKFINKIFKCLHLVPRQPKHRRRSGGMYFQS